jgi:environmental stress-induced protein Ves
MHISVIRSNEQHADRWAGGLTTQLYIYPEHSRYAERDFVFRISTATVETETSAFTSLPGISRILMVLSGTMHITHEHHYSKTLHPMDTDIFDGGWKTSSSGKVTDFNLMTSAGATGILSSHTLETGELTVQATAGFTGYYIASGSVVIDCNGINTHLYERDFLIMRADIPVQVTMNTESNATVVCCSVKVSDVP